MVIDPLVPQLPPLDEDPPALDEPTTSSGPIGRFQRVMAKGFGRRRSFPALIIIGLAIISLGLMQNSGYVLVSPGPSWPVQTDNPPLDKAYDPARWNLLTIEVSDLSWWGMLSNLATRNYPMVQPSYLASGYSNQAAQMQQSEKTAAALAYSLTNPSVKLVPTGAIVLGVEASSPASIAGVQVGDAITGLNGSTITRAKELENLHPGSYQLDVVRSGDHASLNMHVKSKGTGLMLATRLATVTPPLSPAAPREVGGGSAGLVYTLAMLDALEPGDLSGGLKVAATGTISEEGAVGRVSGVSEKLLGAKEQGMDVVFIPKDTVLDQDAPLGLEIVRVSHVLDAVDYLCAHGGKGQVCSVSDAGGSSDAEDDYTMTGEPD